MSAGELECRLVGQGSMLSHLHDHLCKVLIIYTMGSSWISIACL